MPEKVKDMLYTSALFWAKVKWKITKPKTNVARILLITDQKILLVQHRKSLTWNLPGGGKKKKEAVEHCAIRELYEETQIHIHDTDYLLGTYESIKGDKQDTVYIYVKHIPYEIDPRSKSDLELTGAGWYLFDNLPSEATDSTRLRVEEYLSGKKNIKEMW
jgi:8-oxo-dGTP pyrophosphatase MutT (NUDIX family)